jgi:hypothetical protein
MYPGASIYHNTYESVADNKNRILQLNGVFFAEASAVGLMQGL